MNHYVIPSYKKCRQTGGTHVFNKLFCFFVFAFLICNTAAGFASRLARSLAFTTTAVFCAFAKILSFKCLNSFHYSFLQRDYFLSLYHGHFKKSRYVLILCVIFSFKPYTLSCISLRQFLR